MSSHRYGRGRPTCSRGPRACRRGPLTCWPALLTCWRGLLTSWPALLTCWRGLLTSWRDGGIALLVVCVLGVQSLAGVMPALGAAHHHESLSLLDAVHHAAHDPPRELRHGQPHGLPHELPHELPRETHAGPPSSSGDIGAWSFQAAPTTQAEHQHASVERHHHGSPADTDGRLVPDEAIDQLLDDLMLRLGSVASALAGKPAARPGRAFAPVRVAHPGTRLRWRPPDLPYRPPIA